MAHKATYCPEDNKLRFYPDWQDGDFDKERLKASGYRWASKQECYVCPRWSPSAEDAALEYVEDIGDEDYSPAERAADRAERFDGYRGKRITEATSGAVRFDAGPSVHGYQSQAKAERSAARHDRIRVRSISQWDKAEYWQERTRGVISHALYKSSPAVRRSRIKRLEADQRKHLSGVDATSKRLAAWRNVAEMEGADVLLPLDESGYVDREKCNAAQIVAYKLAKDGRSLWRVYHPTSTEANAESDRVHTYGGGFSAYDFLTDNDYIGKPFARLTPRQVAELFLSTVNDPTTEGTHNHRWTRHYELRLGYETAMLENEGGRVSDADMEPGGWIIGGRVSSCLEQRASGWRQIHQVFKSPATGRVTSVKLMGYKSGYTEESGYTKHETNEALVTVNVERLPAEAYRPPTDEEREQFAKATKARKAKEKASKPKAPSLINPTDEDAERLQEILNDLARPRHAANSAKDFEPTPVLKMTQAQYSAAAKGSYSNYETRTIHNAGGVVSRIKTNLASMDGRSYDKKLGPAACKLRTRHCSGWYNPPHVVIITDKPQKPLPVDWERIATGEPYELPESATI